MMERVSSYSGRKSRALLPLFPGYVFFCGSESDRYAAMTTNRLCRTIDIVDQAGLIDELTAIETVLRNKVAFARYPHSAAGRRYRVRSGVLKGVKGVVVQRRRRAELVLQASVLRQGMVVEIDADLLEPTG